MTEPEPKVLLAEIRDGILSLGRDLARQGLDHEDAQRMVAAYIGLPEWFVANPDDPAWGESREVPEWYARFRHLKDRIHLLNYPSPMPIGSGTRLQISPPRRVAGHHTPYRTGLENSLPVPAAVTRDSEGTLLHFDLLGPLILSFLPPADASKRPRAAFGVADAPGLALHHLRVWWHRAGEASRAAFLHEITQTQESPP